MKGAIRMEREENTYTLFYFNDEIGWIDRMQGREKPYRACTKNGRLQYFWSLSTAKDFIVSEMH